MEDKRNLMSYVLPVGSVVAAFLVIGSICIWVGALNERINNQGVRVDKLEERIADTPTMAQFTELKQEVKNGFEKIMDYLQKK